MPMTTGQRIKERRMELGMSVARLAKLAGIAPTTLYDLERSDSKSTTKLHRIAAVLKVHAEWLETGRGVRLIEQQPTSSMVRDSPYLWPFKLDWRRFDRLMDVQKIELEALMEGRIIGFEATRPSPKKKNFTLVPK